MLYQIEEVFFNLTINQYLKCRTVDVILIKAVKKSKLLRRNFTVNTFCENAMLWILSPSICKPHQAYMDNQTGEHM